MSGEDLKPTGNSDLMRSSEPLLPRNIVRRQFLLDTLQETRIILPLAISILSLIYLVLYAHLLGGYFIAGMVALVGGISWAASLLWRAVIRYQQGYNRKLQELSIKLQSEGAMRIEALLRRDQDALEAGFKEIQDYEAITILQRLVHGYRELQRVMASEAEADVLMTSNLDTLVRETFVQGLNVLQHALELERAFDASQDYLRKSDLQILRKKSAIAARDPNSDDSLQLIQEKINFHKERLDMVEKLNLRVDELLHQAERCEASLSKTRIELVELKSDASNERVAAVISTLQQTIGRAKAVQAELKRQGY